MLKIYLLAHCDTCRRAVKWLRAQALPFEERAIRETPPSASELRAALAVHAGEIRKLFNTSGREYLAEKLPGLTPAAAIALLAADGHLVKRPFLTGPGVALTGFDPETWSAALLKR